MTATTFRCQAMIPSGQFQSARSCIDLFFERPHFDTTHPSAALLNAESNAPAHEIAALHNCWSLRCCEKDPASSQPAATTTQSVWQRQCSSLQPMNTTSAVYTCCLPVSFSQSWQRSQQQRWRLSVPKLGSRMSNVSRFQRMLPPRCSTDTCQQAGPMPTARL